MVNFALDQELRDCLAALEQQRQVLEYARSLCAAPRRGVPGKTLRGFAGILAAEDAAQIARAVEEDCESIGPDGW